ncbi:hypothetical protein KR200_002660, partial [Drosophila serrata]
PAMVTGEPGGAEETANLDAAALEHACDQSMRLRRSFRGSRRPVFWWSDEIADLRSTCHRARRQLTRARGAPRARECSEAFRIARKALKVAIRGAKRDRFLQAEGDPWGGAYRMVVKGL